MAATGFTNSWTAGEICDDAWDRTELQQVAKGCEQALNLNIRIAGPLGKRRGFWWNGAANDSTHLVRGIPFKRSQTDAFFLEFGNLVAWVWQINGAPLLNGGVQVHFTTPFADTALAKLRYKQIGDVIYFRSSDGIAPVNLTRTNGGVANADWTFATQTYKNGPWLAENVDLTKTITIGGTSEADTNSSAAAFGNGSILVGQTVTLTGSTPMFNANQVGSTLRLRQTTGSPGMWSWAPGNYPPAGFYALSVGHAYKCKTQGGSTGATLANTPPVQTSGDQTDGDNLWTYRHDGAGIVEITAFTDTTHVTGTVLATVPLTNGQATSFYSFAAYSADQGWPTATPEIREERMVEGAPIGNLDFVDLTQTAGFTPTQQDFTPGTGTGLVVDTNAIRRRLGTDGGQILHFATATYLAAFTTSGEHLIAGSVLDEPLTPAGVTCKQPFSFGSADVRPVQAHKGLLWVVKGAQTLRELTIDTQQNAQTEDHSYLATHIGKRGFAQMAWVADPDNNCWLRLADGGFACFTYHQEQGVKGFTTQQLGGGLVVEDEITLPGIDGLDTLWLVARQTVGGVTQRMILMQSSVSDGLFMDAATFYSGAPVTTLDVPSQFNGQTVDVLADGAWISGMAVADDEITLETAASTVQIGFTYPVEFTSLKLDLRIFNGALLQRQSIDAAIIDLLTAGCTITGENGAGGEYVDVRLSTDLPGAQARRVTREVTIDTITDTETGARDPRILINEQTPYDFVLYAIKSNQVSVGG